ncbi:glycosyltransferase [Micromonospora sp. STR1_7]|uniref:Glycosyltransferase n=1 Tax=Micromonospora parastrephiae TaxID=2806101 RepID=A0ABS1XMH6_9ACTN|nr:glycosyltransferase [Micromonospora parastrephiae]MBM0230471.1 glycosyltransferase [Micromonospora parastrephiae]
MTAPARPAPKRIFLPLAESPLLNHRHDEDVDLAVLLATTADPDPATVRALLSITAMPAADRIARALDERTDLPITSLALLVAHRPDAKQATSALRGRLFPDGTSPGACHRFTRTMATLVHQPALVDDSYLASERFRASAAAADPAVLGQLLAPILDTGALTGPAQSGLLALLDARASRVPTAHIDLAGATAFDRARHQQVRAALLARREQTIRDLADHTAGLTLAAELWYSALTAAVDTPTQASEALALAEHAADILAAGEEPTCAWPAARHRWQQVTTAVSAAEAQPGGWEQAWQAAEFTEDGARWDDTQRALVAGYDLLAEHVRSTWESADAPPTPNQCWAADPTGRALLHLVADHLTGHQTHSPLPHYSDELLIAFVRGLAKNRRDAVPADLHLHGLIAAIKAARSKAALLTRPASTDLGIVVPMRAETHHLTPESGDDALTVKVAQLGWLLQACPDAHADLLLVDESTDGASARAARAIDVDHPQIRVTVAQRPDDTSAKGGAVLWGLTELAGAGRTILAYTDLDLTYPLEQLGLHVAAFDQPGVGAVIGSRRRPDSHGYYPPTGPTPTTWLYQRAVRDLLQLDATDPQAGFKAFPATALRTALPLTADHSLAFDTDLLAAIARSGHTVAEVGVATLYQYVEGHRSAPHDYDTMLNGVHRQALRHGLDPDTRRTPTWDRIRRAGSLAAAAVEPTTTTMLKVPTSR